MRSIRTLILSLTLALTALASSACATSATAQGGADGWDTPLVEVAMVAVDFGGCSRDCDPFGDAKARLEAHAGGDIEIQKVQTVSDGYVITYRILR